MATKPVSTLTPEAPQLLSLIQEDVQNQRNVGVARAGQGMQERVAAADRASQAEQYGLLRESNERRDQMEASNRLALQDKDLAAREAAANKLVQERQSTRDAIGKMVQDWRNDAAGTQVKVRQARDQLIQREMAYSKAVTTQQGVAKAREDSVTKLGGKITAAEAAEAAALGYGSKAFAKALRIISSRQQELGYPGSFMDTGMAATGLAALFHPESQKIAEQRMGGANPAVIADEFVKAYGAGLGYEYRQRAQGREGELTDAFVTVLRGVLEASDSGQETPRTKEARDAMNKLQSQFGMSPWDLTGVVEGLPQALEGVVGLGPMQQLQHMYQGGELDRTTRNLIMTALNDKIQENGGGPEDLFKEDDIEQLHLEKALPMLYKLEMGAHVLGLPKVSSKQMKEMADFVKNFQGGDIRGAIGRSAMSPEQQRLLLAEIDDLTQQNISATGPGEAELEQRNMERMQAQGNLEDIQGGAEMMPMQSLETAIGGMQGTMP